jgi:hypothetical protein
VADCALPIVHSSAEEIAAYLVERLRAALAAEVSGRDVHAIAVGVAERPTDGLVRGRRSEPDRRARAGVLLVGRPRRRRLRVALIRSRRGAMLVARCGGCHRVYAPGSMTAEMALPAGSHARALADRGIPAGRRRAARSSTT